MPNWAWSPAMATWATARSPSCGGRHEHRRGGTTRSGTSAADTDARAPALLGRHARRPVRAPALRRLRQGAALSATGLPALLFDGKQLQGSADGRRDPYLDGLPPSLQLLLQGGRTLHRGAGRYGCKRSGERPTAWHRRDRPQDRQTCAPGLRTGEQRGDAAVLRRRVSFREENK